MKGSMRLSQGSYSSKLFGKEFEFIKEAIYAAEKGDEDLKKCK